jgi:hypothetical protein
MVTGDSSTRTRTRDEEEKEAASGKSARPGSYRHPTLSSTTKRGRCFTSSALTACYPSMADRRLVYVRPFLSRCLLMSRSTTHLSCCVCDPQILKSYDELPFMSIDLRSKSHPSSLSRSFADRTHRQLPLDRPFVGLYWHHRHRITPPY